MKMSIANELFTTNGNAMRIAIPIASRTRLRMLRPNAVIGPFLRQGRSA
ncbi:hypothetical protein GALL_464250 [mine drainage metagenome]|uniref:Uncharacterized protein n=1 Tax=mine drainage metagenome TaxID=410659 RepID=A0A1J5PK82_9ZZZZ